MRISLFIVVVAGLTAMFVALSPSSAVAQGPSESTSPFVTDPDLIPAGPLPAFEPASLLMLESSQHHQELPNEGEAISSLILEKGGNIFWDGQAKKLHADAFTLALTTYRNVEHWIYQWDGTQWVSIGWKKQEFGSV